MKTYESKTYQILNEVFNAITHGAGTILAIVALILLILKGVESGSALEVTAFSIYGAALIILFLCSTLAHSLHFTRAVKVFRVFDHNGIYFLIAGTYTPYCLVALNNWLGWIVLTIIWICAILGIVLTSIYLPKWGKTPKLSTILYVVMGWMILIEIYPLWNALNPLAFWLLVIGGVIYSVGALIYHFKFPFAHVVWHLFVLVAAALMFISVYGFVG
ncbi:PAQR family membrane homeostasis protein TrhA [Lactococcus protaetiae]|uniref:Hemolysin III family protein n=1 Tax=Lactococcus protaetiae TaxID=2592653 RepID=A0A514Z7W1_9LACT|nr:hemolysin III family protein [Lactococcus protaetiae]MCL2113296.1 hemolysin III family protein [Streptococcaceae bacterium]QDK70672.1 hemolysin III family protein [Lactococcus protaetiae]